jgi:hypothetical protein
MGYKEALKKQFPVTLPPSKEQRMALKIATRPLSLSKSYLKHVKTLAGGANETSIA